MSNYCNGCKACKKCRFKRYLNYDENNTADKQSILNDVLKFSMMPAQLKPATETLTIKSKDNVDFLSLLTFYGKLVVPKTKYTEHLINNQNEFLLIIPLLRDTVALSHAKFIKQFDIYFSLSRNLFNSSKNQIKFQYFNRNLVWSCYNKFLKSCDNSFALYVNELPGIDRISIQDYGKLIHDKVYIVIDLCLRELFVDGECYLYVDGVNLDKYWMNEFFGKEQSDNLFETYRVLNQLNPTRNEIALLAAFVITSGSDTAIYYDKGFIQGLNRHYHEVLMYEFSLNERSSAYIQKAFQIVNNLGVLKGRYMKVHI